MSDRASLFLGPVVHEPDGPGLLGRRMPTLAVLGSGLVLCLGLIAGTVVYTHGACQQRIAQARPADRAAVVDHLRLHAERDRLTQRVAQLEAALEEGHGCRLSLIKYKLELLQIEEQLTCCDVERARIRQQIAELNSYRDLILSRYRHPHH